jgi:hypothetical protein
LYNHLAFSLCHSSVSCNCNIYWHPCYDVRFTVRDGYVGLHLLIPWIVSTNFGTCFGTWCSRPSSDPPSSQEISGGGVGVETTVKIRQIEVTETASFVVV